VQSGTIPPDISYTPSRVTAENTGRPLLRRVSIVLTVLYLAGTILGGIGLGEMAVHPGRRPIPENEAAAIECHLKALNAKLQNASIRTSDGVLLRGWFLRPASGNGDAIILLHGVSDNRLGMYGYGEWLLRNGYSVLLPDARAHGLSESELATYGLKESDDVHRWVSWLEENEQPHCIFGFGESMGAAQILQSLAKETRFCAVVAESPFESFREVSYARFGSPFHTGPWLGRTFFWPTDEIGFLYVRWRYGLNMDSASPKKAVSASKVPVLLIHGLSDHNIPSYNSEDIRAANRSTVALWLVPQAGHCGAHAVVPEEFDRRILSWFSEHSPRNRHRTETRLTTSGENPLLLR
jgi:uncharacterized protein